MEKIDLEDFRPLNDFIEQARAIIRKLKDIHFENTLHDEKRKILEMKFFLKTFRFITKKWNVEILYELEIHDGMYFNELIRHLKGISSKSLSDCLKQLETLNLIIRSVQNDRPPKVLYQLSEKGRGFVELSQIVIFYLAGI